MNFQTPPHIAKYMASMMPVNSRTFLDPSPGEGSLVTALLITELIKRGQKFKAFMNHAKVTCLSNGHDFLVMEGSANFTSNPRIEQTTITNSRELFEFHAGWIRDAFNKKKGI